MVFFVLGFFCFDIDEVMGLSGEDADFSQQCAVVTHSVLRMPDLQRNPSARVL
jgi:hypothetical protein